MCAQCTSSGVPGPSVQMLERALTHSQASTSTAAPLRRPEQAQAPQQQRPVHAEASGKPRVAGEVAMQALGSGWHGCTGWKWCAPWALLSIVGRACALHVHVPYSSGALRCSPAARAFNPAALTDVSLSTPSPAARVTPAKLAALSAALHMPVKQIQDLVLQQPELLEPEPEELQLIMARLGQELGMGPHDVRVLLVRYPRLALQTEPAQLKQSAQALAAAMGIKLEEVLHAAGSVPSILKREPGALALRLKRTAEVLGMVQPAKMLRVASEAPQFLTEPPSGVEKRLERACLVLRKPRRLVARAVVSGGQPDLLFMSPRILANKLRAIQAILDKQARHVHTIALACPSLLRADLDRVRATFEALPQLTGLTEGHAYAMVCHAPGLILEPVEKVAGRARFLRRAVAAVPSWGQQWARFSPALVADCLTRSRATYARVEYLLASQKVGAGMLG